MNLGPLSITPHNNTPIIQYYQKMEVTDLEAEIVTVTLDSAISGAIVSLTLFVEHHEQVTESMINVLGQLEFPNAAIAIKYLMSALCYSFLKQGWLYTERLCCTVDSSRLPRKKLIPRVRITGKYEYLLNRRNE
jgi:hypothetical protein